VHNNVSNIISLYTYIYDEKRRRRDFRTIYNWSGRVYTRNVLRMNKTQTSKIEGEKKQVAYIENTCKPRRINMCPRRFNLHRHVTCARCSATMSAVYYFGSKILTRQSRHWIFRSESSGQMAFVFEHIALCHRVFYGRMQPVLLSVVNHNF